MRRFTKGAEQPLRGAGAVSGGRFSSSRRATYAGAAIMRAAATIAALTAPTAFAAAATVIAVAFTLSTLDRWLTRRRPHEAAWTIALAMFAVASGALWYGLGVGWDGPSFRTFYLLGGITNVPFLALGTIYLLAGERRARPWAVAITLLSVFAAGVVVAAPFRHPLPATGIPSGAEVFGPLPRLFAGVGSGVAALIVIAGALWSAASLLRRGRRPGGSGAAALPARRLAGANGLIALGTIVIGAKSLFTPGLDETTGFPLALAAGIALIFAGFLVASAEPSPGRPAAPTTSAQGAPEDLAAQTMRE